MPTTLTGTYFDFASENGDILNGGEVTTKGGSRIPLSAEMMQYAIELLRSAGPDGIPLGPHHQTQPPEGSLGRALTEKFSGPNPASYVGALLHEHGYVDIIGRRPIVLAPSKSS